MGGLREQKLDTWAALIMNYTCVFGNANPNDSSTADAT